MLGDPGYKFCPKCGTAFDKRRLKDFEPERLVCPACHFVFYLNPKVAAGAVVEYQGGIVLLRREIDPRAGFWVHPGGFVDRGETLEAAARRETFEEVGLDVEIGRLLGAYSFAESEVVVVTFAARALSGTPMVGDESLEVAMFQPRDIPWDRLAFPSTHLALKEYLRTMEGGAVLDETISGPLPAGWVEAYRPRKSRRSVLDVTIPGRDASDDGRSGQGAFEKSVLDETLTGVSSPGFSDVPRPGALPEESAAPAAHPASIPLDEGRLTKLLQARSEAFGSKDVRAASQAYPELIEALRSTRRYREALAFAEEGLALTHDPLIARLADEVAHELAESEQDRC